MTRAEVYSLIDQVMEAKAELTMAEMRFSELNNRLAQVIHETFPLPPLKEDRS